MTGNCGDVNPFRSWSLTKLTLFLLLLKWEQNRDPGATTAPNYIHNYMGFIAHKFADQNCNSCKVNFE